MTVDVDTLPWSPVAEQSVLGGLMLDNRAWDLAADLLDSRHFFSAQHRIIFDAVAALINASKPADPITVYERLMDLGRDEEAGGIEYLTALTQAVPSASNIRRYAEIVVEKHTDRELRETADECNTIAQGIGTPADRLERIIGRFGALERRGAKQVPVGLDTIIPGRVDNISDAATRGGALMGIRTGLPQLDKILRGLHPGRVYLLGGRPSLGKSALAQAISLLAAVDQQVTTLFLSQEMPKEELGDRSLAIAGGPSYARIQDGNLSDRDWGLLTEATEKCSSAPFYVDDQPGLTAGDIRVKARLVKGLRLLVVDYVQLCKGAEEGDVNRNTELEVISRSLKELAKQMGVAVVVLSQLARRVDERPHKRPIMSDLKDCGGLEQDADAILTLWRIKKFDGYELIGLDVLKNRQGQSGKCIVLKFFGEYLRWEESEYEVEQVLKKPGKGDDVGEM